MYNSLHPLLWAAKIQSLNLSSHSPPWGHDMLISAWSQWKSLQPCSKLYVVHCCPLDHAGSVFFIVLLCSTSMFYYVHHVLFYLYPFHSLSFLWGFPGRCCNDGWTCKTFTSHSGRNCQYKFGTAGNFGPAREKVGWPRSAVRLRVYQMDSDTGWMISSKRSKTPTKKKARASSYCSLPRIIDVHFMCWTEWNRE